MLKNESLSGMNGTIFLHIFYQKRYNDVLDSVCTVTDTHGSEPREDNSAVGKV